jgi:FkbM family methyltransferase
MAKSFRRSFLKLKASFLKRYHLAFHGGYTVGSAHGCRFLLDWRHPVDKKVAVGLFEEDRIVFFMNRIEHLKPDMFLDIGAHAALYTVLAKTRVPSMEAHAFEPDPTNLGQLQANLFLNKLCSAVKVHPFGLSSEASALRFAASGEHEHRAFSRVAQTGGIEIQVKPLDSVLQDRDRTVAAKIDVEGHELQVVAGAKGFLRGNRCYLQIESGPENLPQLKTVMAELGYRLVASMGDHYFTNLPDSAL